MALLAPLVITLICIVLFFLVWRVDSRYTIMFTPFLLLMVNEFLRVLPAFIYASIQGITTDPYALLVFFLSFVALLSGFVCSVGYFRYRTSVSTSFLEKEVIIDNEQAILLVILSGSFVLVLLGLYLYQGFPSVTQAILGLIVGEEGTALMGFVKTSREELTKGYYFGGAYRGQGAVRTITQLGWPFFSSLALIVYLKTRRYFWLFLTSILLLVSFVFVAGDGTRKPFLDMMVMLIVLYSLVRKIHIRYIVFIGVGIVTLALAMSLYSTKLVSIMQQDSFIVSAFSKIFERILIINAINDVYSINFIDTGLLDYRLGALHLRDIKALLPGTEGGVPFAFTLFQILHPGQTATTYATGTYLTKAYVDFGLIGVGLIYFMLGSFAGFCENIMFKSKKTPLVLTIVSFFSYALGSLVLTGPVALVLAMTIMMIFYGCSYSVVIFRRIVVIASRSYKSDLMVKSCD